MNGPTDRLPARNLALSLALLAGSTVRFLLLLPLGLLVENYAGSRSAWDSRLFRPPRWKAIRYPDVYTGFAESQRMIDRENRLRKYRR